MAKRPDGEKSENPPNPKPEYTHINVGGSLMLSYLGQGPGKMGQTVRKFQGCSPTQEEVGIYKANLIPVGEFAILYPKVQSITSPSPLPRSK